MKVCLLLHAGWLVAAASVASADVPTTRPATTAEPVLASQADLEACMQHGRAAFTAIEQALVWIEQNEVPAGSLGETRADLDVPLPASPMAQLRLQLLDAREHVSRSLTRLEHLRQGPSVRATTISGLWACPLHPQVKQDRPGNCTICDATLAATPGPPVATRPALALAPDRTPRVPQ